MSSLQGISPISTRMAGSTGSATDKTAENAKIDKSAKEFEAILLTSWLQQAYSSFGQVPGGEEDESADPGKDQYQALAMQSLGTSMTAAGGLGISKVIAQHLHKAADTTSATAEAEKASAGQAAAARSTAAFSTGTNPIEISGDTSR